MITTTGGRGTGPVARPFFGLGAAALGAWAAGAAAPLPAGTWEPRACATLVAFSTETSAFRLARMPSFINSRWTSADVIRRCAARSPTVIGRVISTAVLVPPAGGAAVGVFKVTVPPNGAISHQRSVVSKG